MPDSASRHAPLGSATLAFAIMLGGQAPGLLPAEEPDATVVTPEGEELLNALANSASEREARQIEAAIWRHWLSAPDARAQELLDKALERRRWYDYAGALPFLDRLIEDYPDYAEGWNQRATIRFLREEYDASLADIAETLAREPAHFGALAGKAIIHMRRGETALGQLALIEALAINPWIRERNLLLPAEGEDL